MTIQVKLFLIKGEAWDGSEELLGVFKDIDRANVFLDLLHMVNGKREIVRELGRSVWCKSFSNVEFYGASDY
jgi:hypothetical protein